MSILKKNGFPDINDRIIYSSLEKIFIPGRFEVLSENPLIIYDPAHNFNALNNLINEIKELYHNKKIVYIISLMTDKADDKTLDLFNPMKNQVIYHLLNDTRAYIPRHGRFTYVASDPYIIIELMNSMYNDDAIFLFTGTFRLYESASWITNSFKNIFSMKNPVRRSYEIEG